MDWEDLPARLDQLVESCRALVPLVKRAASGVYTLHPVAYCYSPDRGEGGLYSPAADRADLALTKAALARAVPRVRAAPLDRLDAHAGDWVKLAYSPTLRAAGEALHVFPGRYPGGAPSHPSPLAAALATMVLGGGLGYGLGRAGKAVLPDGWGHNLPRTGVAAGVLAGLGLGAGWGAVNHATGRPLNSGALTDAAAGARDLPDPNSSSAFDAALPAGAVRDWEARVRAVEKAGGDLAPWYAAACGGFVKEAFGDTFAGRQERPEPTLFDVNIDALGRTLWESGASPALTGQTMGTLYAARQVPDPRASAGWVTGNQLGRMALGAAKDYGVGLAAGAIFNAVAGSPYRAPVFGAGAAALGVIGATLGRLLGR